ncbi:MAG: hypothetical protein ACTSV2_10375 [Candidatus Thorarchaeota archaeon]
MTEYDFTLGAKIILIATIVQFVAFAFALVFESTGTFAIFIGGGAICALVATYAALTDMSMPVSSKGKFGKTYSSDASAAFMFSLFSMIANAFPAIFWILAPGWDLNVTLSVVLALIGLVIILFGGYITNTEWNE